MIAFPNAKINLGLSILNKREDGYHNIESCFCPIQWYDCLEVIESTSFNFYSYGLNIPGDPASNLCAKAYKLIKQDYDIPPIEIHLLKTIPMGAGLGGGSADGVCVLKILNELFDLALSELQLETYGSKLGSDCPFFVKNKPAIVRKRGEQLQPIAIDLSGYHLAIYNLGIHVSTKDAYERIIPAVDKYPIHDIISKPIHTWKKLLVNDFEASVFPLFPSISHLKKEMYEAGALYASMTGSGSAVFGIFEQIPESPWKVIPLS